tara:strand:- start:167 stop:337 length:171 start_codon:yes stop_codon:yes gene_type:complete
LLQVLLVVMVHQVQFQVLDILLAEAVDLPISLVQRLVLVEMVVEVQDNKDLVVQTV